MIADARGQDNSNININQTNMEYLSFSTNGLIWKACKISCPSLILEEEV